MDKTCSIVQDLLPLYEEDMLREETKEFVDGHLAQCAACRAELDALKADVTPAPVSAQPLRDLKRQLRRKKLTAVLLAVTLALTLATAGFAYLTAPQYLPYSETEWAISRSPSALADDGSAADGLSDLSGAESISVSLLVPVSGAEVTNTQDPNSGKTIYFITAWRTPLDTWRGAFDKTGGTPNTHSANDRTQREADALQGVLAKAESARTLFTLDAANCTAVCYSQNNGQDDVLLCGSMNGGIISLPRHGHRPGRADQSAGFRAPRRCGARCRRARTAACGSSAAQGQEPPAHAARRGQHDARLHLRAQRAALLRKSGKLRRGPPDASPRRPQKGLLNRVAFRRFAAGAAHKKAAI